MEQTVYLTSLAEFVVKLSVTNSKEYMFATKETIVLGSLAKMELLRHRVLWVFLSVSDK